MTLWSPDLRKWGKPHYLAIVEALADDIRTGRLPVGTQLPPQRTLASQLDLNFTTVARGYVEAQRRGLVEGRVGQGTFVSDPARHARSAASTRRGPVDFTMNLPPEPEDSALLARMQASFKAIAADLPSLLRYQGFGGTESDKAAALSWLARRGVQAPRDRLLICPGAHSALSAILTTIAKPGEAICVERLTYPGVRALAAHLSFNLVDLPMDEQGVEPEAFAAACTRVAPRAIYLNPVLQNPTTTTIRRARREAIIEVARRYAVAVIEDDAYGFVCPTPPPSFYALAPEITYYVGGLAKCLGAGLRLAYLVASNARAALPLAGALRAGTVMASPITTALATRWIEDGCAEAVVGFIRSESSARQTVARRLLPSELVRADPNGFHIWLSLPDGWTRAAFASQARAAGLGVVGSDAFCAVGAAPEAVRVCLGGMATRVEITNALEVVAHVLERSPALASSYI